MCDRRRSDEDEPGLQGGKEAGDGKMARARVNWLEERNDGRKKYTKEKKKTWEEATFEKA